MRNPVYAVLSALSLAALAGCDQLDPLTRPYMWHESGVNASNIAAMAAKPDDLVRGRDNPRHFVTRELAAVDRVMSGKPRPLLSGGGGGGGGGGGDSSGGAGGGSGGPSGAGN